MAPARPRAIEASHEIEQLGPCRRKPRGVGQPLVHRPAGAAVRGPAAVGHQRVDVAPVGGGQRGHGGVAGAEQPGGVGVALDGRVLGGGLTEPA
jgi:hypothetical protein